MRVDVRVKEALARCEVLKHAGVWPAEPLIRPRAWMNNFDDSDRMVASALLNKFTFYSAKLSDSLLVAAYLSLVDGMTKGPAAASAARLSDAISSAFFTPLEGEEPNPTDSGNFLCRRARQVLGVPQERIVTREVAIQKAHQGFPIVFLDDFLGSGDQFISTWERTGVNGSFSSAHRHSSFAAIYITLVCSKRGIERVHSELPHVAISCAHTLEERSTIQGVMSSSADAQAKVHEFLYKYASRLLPNEAYIADNPRYRLFGYKEAGLMLAFEHSVPDATLPIFWSPGIDGWSPLLERT